MTTLSRPMTRRIALLTTLLVLALPAAAGAQSGAFGPLPPAQATPTPTPTVASTVDDGSTGRNVLFIVGGALIVGFAVMGWFILRDARGRRASPSSPARACATRARTSTRCRRRPRRARRRTPSRPRARPTATR